MGGKVIGKAKEDGGKAISPGGFIIHEVGTTRMGNHPRQSVLNAFNQAHDVPNLFVTDGGAFVSNAVAVEAVFDWPGLGSYLVQAIFAADYAAVLAVTLVIGLVYGIVNIVVDVAHGLLDPRVAERM